MKSKLLFILIIGLGSLGCSLSPSLEAVPSIPEDAQTPISQNILTFESLSDGFGQTLHQKTLEVGESFDIYSIERDSNGNFVANIDVSWILNGSAGNLDILQGGKKSTFHALTTGASEVKVSYGNSQNTLQITVIPPSNLAPNAVDDGPVVTPIDTLISVDVVANDTDPNGDSLTVVAVGTPTNGTAVINANKIDFTPSSGFIGKEVISYTISDGNGLNANGSFIVYTASAYTWSGKASDDNWSSMSNWCGSISSGQCQGGSPPTNSDLAIFSNTCENCNAVLDTNVSVKGLHLQNNYTGTISQSTGMTLEVGSDNYTQESGHFIGSNSQIYINNGSFNLSAGSFTSTSDELKVFIDGNVDRNIFTVSSTASFIPNNGSITLNGQRPWQCGNTIYTVDVPNLFEVYNLEIMGKTSGCGGGSSSTSIKPGSALVVNNNLLLTGGSLDGDIQLKGNLIQNSGTHGFTDFSLGNANIIFNGTGNQTYSIPRDNAPLARITVDKSSGVVSSASPSLITLIKSLTIQNGTFIAPSAELIINSDGATDHVTPLSFANGTTFDANGGTITLVGRTENGYAVKQAKIDINNSATFNNLNVAYDLYGTRLLTFNVINSPVVVDGAFSHLDSRLYGNLTLNGDSTFASSLPDPGTAIISFKGVANQNLVQTGNFPTGNVMVDKSSGVVTLNSAVNLIDPAQSLTLTSGGVNMNGNHLTIGSQLNLNSGTQITLGGATLTVNGSGLSTGAYDNGVINP